MDSTVDTIVSKSAVENVSVTGLRDRVSAAMFSLPDYELSSIGRFHYQTP